MPGEHHDETRALAHLPGLDIEIIHRRPREGDSDETMLISLRATPSFEAFGRALEAANPLALWLRMVQAAWSPWLALLAPPGETRRIDRE